jgi:hypothetical protein
MFRVSSVSSDGSDSAITHLSNEAVFDQTAMISSTKGHPRRNVLIVGTSVQRHCVVHLWRKTTHLGSIFKYSSNCIYKACSKKDRTFAIKTLFYNILSTVPFKVVPPTGDTPFPTFLPLLECFLERTFCDGAQFSYRIFLNLRVFKKRPNFSNSAPTSTVDALRLLSVPSGRVLTTKCHLSRFAMSISRVNPTNSLCTCSVQRM